MSSPVAEQQTTQHIPIPLESLLVGTLVAFDLYIARERDQGNAPANLQLYRKRDLPITQEHIDRLMASGVQALFVKTEDRKAYRQYLESNLHQILTDDAVEPSRKIEIVYEAASGLIEDVWRNPTSPESVQRSVALVNDTFNRAVNQQRSMKYLLSVMSSRYTTYTHSVNVCLYALALAKELQIGTAVIQDLGLGALLHDVGKIRVDEKILDKPGPLTSEEWRIVKRHPEYGLSILEKAPPLPEGVYRIVHEHHEKCDGSGYPRALAEDEIHPQAKICCLIDVFDALTSDRAYKRAVPAFEALRIMRDEMAGCFDMDLWRTFATLLTTEE